MNLCVYVYKQAVMFCIVFLVWDFEKYSLNWFLYWTHPENKMIIHMIYSITRAFVRAVFTIKDL